MEESWAAKRAREYCEVSNEIGALPNTPEGVAKKREWLHEKLFPFFTEDVDMFGLVGYDNVIEAVEKFFLETYVDSLRWEYEVENVEKHLEQIEKELPSAFSIANYMGVFRFDRHWRDVSTGQRMKQAGGLEVVLFENAENGLAKKFFFLEKPNAAEKVIPQYFTLTVHVTFPDALNRDKWLKAVRTLKKFVREKEKESTLTFSIGHNESDPLKLVLIERYVSREAFEEHKKSEVFKAFVESLKGIERTLDAKYFTEDEL